MLVFGRVCNPIACLACLDGAQICGDLSHPTRDCPLKQVRTLPHCHTVSLTAWPSLGPCWAFILMILFPVQTSAESEVVLDSEYDSFMAELTDPSGRSRAPAQSTGGASAVDYSSTSSSSSSFSLPDGTKKQQQTVIHLTTPLTGNIGMAPAAEVNPYASQQYYAQPSTLANPYYGAYDQSSYYAVPHYGMPQTMPPPPPMAPMGYAPPPPVPVGSFAPPPPVPVPPPPPPGYPVDPYHYNGYYYPPPSNIH